MAQRSGRVLNNLDAIPQENVGTWMEASRGKGNEALVFGWAI